MKTSRQQQQQEPIIIDTQTKEPLQKEHLIDLLKMHKVKTATAECPDIKLQDVIPTLRKAKQNLPEKFFNHLAEKLGLTFIEFTQIKELYRSEQKSKLITILPYKIISKYKIIPLEVNDGAVELAMDNPVDERVLLTLQYLFRSWRINLHVVSSRSIEWAIENIYREIHKNQAMLELYNRTPDQSAHKVLYPKQKIFIAVIATATVAAAILSTALTLAVIFAAVSIGYFIVNPIKLYISLYGFRGVKSATRISKGEMQWVHDEDLPVYTILIPVFHEANVLSQIMKNMYNLNYPKEKLDIKILMEEKDQETIKEAKLLGMFGSVKKRVEGIPNAQYSEFLKLFDPIIIPSANITTKPRACNYGLLRAKGELCVIYDAEDKPHPDQLKKAAIVFLRSNENVVCLQSKLNFYNADENLLTKWFSIEYGNWYEFYLQGLDWIDAPIPLGGTSNHFRKKGLDELGRWDPYNVTEDADIGIRLARQKMKTEMVDTCTYEEAPIDVKSWVIQRSRWYKGHLQTYLVHMRSPQKLFHDLGAKKFFKFQLTFGTSVFIPIVNPLLWLLFAATLLLPLSFGWLIPIYLMPITLFNLIVGNLSYLSIYVVSCIKLKKQRYIPHALLMPFYWVLLSVAGWRGLIQLATNPFHWDKTTHGKTKMIH